MKTENDSTAIYPFNLELFKAGVNAFDANDTEYKFVNLCNNSTYPVTVLNPSDDITEKYTEEGRYYGRDIDEMSNKDLAMKQDKAPKGQEMKSEPKQKKPKLIKMNKEYTINSLPVTILSIELGSEDYPVIAVDNKGTPFTFTKEGKYTTDGNMEEYNLQEVPKPKAEYKTTVLYQNIKKTYKGDKIKWKEIKKELKQVYFDEDVDTYFNEEKVSRAFSWSTTEQGLYYWKAINDFMNP